MNIQEILEKKIREALASIEPTFKGEVALSHPAELAHGDYASAIALSLGKTLKINPLELAKKIKAALEEKKDSAIEKIEIAGPGFINFYLSREFFTGAVQEIVTQKEHFGSSKSGAGKKVLVEYSSANIAKPFTIGHLRSTIIGDSLARILEFSGYKVIRDNHLGDWGTQFGKQIVAIKKWSSIEAIKKSDNQMRALVDLYVRFHQEAEKDPTLEDEARAWFLKLEQGDAEARAIYDVTINASMSYFTMIYERLRVTPFDTLHGEAFYEPVIAGVLEDIKKTDLARESEGARLIFFKDEKYPPLMIQKKDGATLYATRDLATDKWRSKEYGKDTLVINETGSEQSLYFKQIFEAEELLGYFEKKNRVHIGHGFIRSKDGKMSTRKGNVIWLEEVLDEAVSRAAAINAETKDVVGIGAIKFNDLKREAKQDIIFDWDEVVNLKGDSGPYLQYSCVRAHSIVAKAAEAAIYPAFEKIPQTIFDLEKMLYRFPEIVLRAGKEYAPHYIATYLIELSAYFNNFYATNKLVDTTDEMSAYKVALAEAFGIVVKNGLSLLGIEVPAKM